MWNAESYPWHECALKTSRGGPSRLATFKPTRGPAFPARSGRSPVTTSSLRSGRWSKRPVFVEKCLHRPLLVISSGAESRHLYESGGTERTCLSSGRLLHCVPPSVGTSVEATCIRWDVLPPPTTGHVERSDAESRHLYGVGNTDQGCQSPERLLHVAPLPSRLWSKRPVFVGTCLPRPLLVMSSGTKWSRDPRRAESLRPSGRGDLGSTGTAFPRALAPILLSRPSILDSRPSPALLSPLPHSPVPTLPTPDLTYPHAPTAAAPQSARSPPPPAP